MSMGHCQLSIGQCIVSVVKLGDVSAKVLLNNEFSAGMNSFITIYTKNQIVAND